MRSARFEVYLGVSGRWYWRLRAANGLVIADGSEGYATRANAFRAARRAVNVALTAEDSLFNREREIDAVYRAHHA